VVGNWPWPTVILNSPVAEKYSTYSCLYILTDTGVLSLLATLESKKCRAWYGFIHINWPQTCMVHSHYGSCLLLPLLIGLQTTFFGQLKKPCNVLRFLDFAPCVARSDKTPVHCSSFSRHVNVVIFQECKINCYHHVTELHSVIALILDYRQNLHI